jgi:hypothetical protein
LDGGHLRHIQRDGITVDGLHIERRYLRLVVMSVVESVDEVPLIGIDGLLVDNSIRAFEDIETMPTITNQI